MTLSTYTDVSICSAALTMIGARPINSIADPATDIEATCARLYPLVVSTLLSKHEWNFANPVSELAVDADVTALFDYTYAHKLPSDLKAGPFAVYGNNDLKNPISNYENANDYIHSDYETIHVRYRRSPAIEIWPDYFTDLVVCALGQRLAKPVADNTGLGQELRILAFGPAEMDGQGGMFADAKRIDGQSQKMRSLFSRGDPLTATRC